jgi:hypothetical protein
MTIMGFKIATLNLCLGLPNKKNIVKEMFITEKLDILCLQETEHEINLDHNLLDFPGVNYESENNQICSRVGTYIKTSINYIRRRDLEGLNSHLVIIDIKCEKNLRVINIYRPFNPQNGYSPRDFFRYQMDLIKQSFTSNTVLLGDFNLDIAKKGAKTYRLRAYFDCIDLALGELNNMQLVDFPTWSRSVNGILRESILDHVYVSDPTSVLNLSSLKPHFGDHRMVYFDVFNGKTEIKSQIKRNWMHYTKESLLHSLSQEDWNLQSDNVQGCWNKMENKIIRIVDQLAPLQDFKNNSCTSSRIVPPSIKNLINQRKKLLARLRSNFDINIKEEIRNMDKVIRAHFHNRRTADVKRAIIPGNCSSLWRAVKIAKDTNMSGLPNTMFESGGEIPTDQLADKFGAYFDSKIRNVLRDTGVDEEVYNGARKVNAENLFYMDIDSIRECIKSLSIKNSEGFDRIPQRVIVDGCDILVKPFSILFKKIYWERSAPHQWLVSKTIPVYKNKGEKKDIESYRPIANLCSASKIFEKLILRRIMKIQSDNNCDLTGVNQHGFKQKRSTSTLATEIQSIISRALDGNKIVLMSSLDLTAAFDVVNIDLLLKRLTIMGLPEDVISLIRVWLSDRSYYVSVEGANSIMYDLLLGTVQGSILGPVLYAIFVSPLFDLEDLFAFADDTFILRTSSNLGLVIESMEESLSVIIKWMKQSGLKINESKTEVCVFNKHLIAKPTVNVGPNIVTAKDSMNVLGVIFDMTLSWSKHVQTAVTKANRALNALKLIRKYFNTKELLQLITSNFYSVLFYNSEVWHLNNLKYSDKQLLLSTSSKALKMAIHYRDPLISNNNVHLITKRATPEMYSSYKLSLLLYKTFNYCIPLDEWSHLNFEQTFGTRQEKFHVNLNNNLRVGMNALCNRFHFLNDKIPLDWLNKSFLAYKIECKKFFLSYE